jgi:signal transduction histidine kinase
MSLRGKIVALVLGLTLALLAGLWAALSRAWTGWSAATVERELLDRAVAIAGHAELEHGGLELDDEEEAPELHDPVHPWRIVGPDGAALGGGGADVAWPAAGPASREPWFGDVSGASGRIWRVVSTAATIEAHLARGRKGTVEVTVQVAGEAAPHRALEERFRRGLLVALAAALVVGGLGSAVLAHVSLAPLRRMASEADSIGAASLERRVNTAGLDPELRRVAGALDALLARLDDAMQRQRHLVSRASHSLRTPVATILTRAEVALRRERDPAAYREALADVVAAARESSALVAHLLTLSALDERRGGLDLEDLPLAEVTHEVARLLTQRAAETGIALAVDVPEELIVRADRRALRELLEALVDNAVHHTPRGGRAGVRAQDTAAGCAVTVWDSGPGIPADEREKVLERFYRGRHAQASGLPGSGLGLAIVKAIADAHGAGLTLGDRPGGGLEATVVLAAGTRPGTLGPTGRATSAGGGRRE